MNENYKTFDFTTPIEKTATILARGIAEKLADNRDLLIFETDKKNPMPFEPKAPSIPLERDTTEMSEEEKASYEAGFEQAKTAYVTAKAVYDEALAVYNDAMKAWQTVEDEKRQREEACTDFAIEIMKMISATDIPADYAGLAVDKIIAVLGTLKKYVQGTVNQYQNEFVSRALGVKSPVDGKYRAEFATVGELLLKLEEVRNAQGGVKTDYFDDEKLSTDGEGVDSGK